MDSEQLFQQVQTGQVDNSTTGLNMDSIMQQLEGVLLFSTIVSFAILIPFVILFLVNARRKWKVQSAIFDMQKTLHEINDRAKANAMHTDPLHPLQVPAPAPATPPARQPSPTTSATSTPTQFSRPSPVSRPAQQPTPARSIQEIR